MRRRRFRRSEYQHAINLARKARRSGDAISSERWLKHADRHLAIDDRLQASLGRARGAKDSVASKRSREEEARTMKERQRVYRELEEEYDRIDTMDD